MKKKIALTFMLLCVCGLCFGCGMSTSMYVMDNLAEVTKVYYFGQCADFYAVLNSGMREKEYLIDGKCGDCTEFALLSLKMNEVISVPAFSVKVKIDCEVLECEVEQNGMYYMYDLARELSGNENIEIIYENTTLSLVNMSKDFNVDYVKAVEIACENLKDKITLLKKGQVLNAECYLRVLDKKTNNFDEFFWCFTVVNTNDENFSIIISTKDGKVLAKS